MFGLGKSAYASRKRASASAKLPASKSCCASVCLAPARSLSWTGSAAAGTADDTSVSATAAIHLRSLDIAVLEPSAITTPAPDARRGIRYIGSGAGERAMAVTTLRKDEGSGSDPAEPELFLVVMGPNLATTHRLPASGTL